MKLTRRSVLKASGAGIGATLAGCVGGPGDDSGGSSGGVADVSSAYTAFFALSDWVEAVAGDELSVETAVTVGQLGHGWEPPSDLPFDVAESDVFIYVDSPEFRWAQNLADQVAEEGVTLINVMDGVNSSDLLDWDHEHDHDHHHDDGHDDGHDDHDEHHDDEHHDDEHHDDEHHDDGHNDGHDDHDDEHHDDHDDHDGPSEFHDPHVWVDPVLAQDMVEYVAEELAELDPENEENYRENADEYTEQLEGVHQQFLDLTEEATRDVSIFAGHVSYQYVEDRYGFRIHSPQGISPDAEPSQDDIAETIELVEDYDIDTILYDPFDTPDDSPPALAQRILDSTDATEARPVSPLAGTTQEWLDDGWGWVEQMEELNIPSFRAALGAE